MTRQSIEVYEVGFYGRDFDGEQWCPVDQLIGIPDKEDLQKIAKREQLDVEDLDYFKTHTYI